MQECAGKPQSQHTSTGRRSTNGRQNVARTHCVLPKQNSMYLRQFLIINKNTLKMFVGENLTNVIKNGPLPKVKCRGRPFIASSSLSTSDEVHLHPWELQKWTNAHYKSSVRTVGNSSIIQPFFHHIRIYWMFAICLA